MLVIIICVVIAILVWWFAFGHPVSRWTLHTAARTLIINVSFREQVEIQIVRFYYVYLFNKTLFYCQRCTKHFCLFICKGNVERCVG